MLPWCSWRDDSGLAWKITDRIGFYSPPPPQQWNSWYNLCNHWRPIYCSSSSPARHLRLPGGYCIIYRAPCLIYSDADCVFVLNRSSYLLKLHFFESDRLLEWLVWWSSILQLIPMFYVGKTMFEMSRLRKY